MKIFTLLLLIYTYSLCAGTVTYPELYNMPVLFDGSKIPGVKPIKGNYLYMAETEMSNRHYREFLYDLRKNNLPAYNSNYPNLKVWSKEMEKFGQSYFENPAMGNFPVVGISKEQALNYCKWLQEKLILYFADKKIPVKRFIVRLPTESEWESAARGGLSTNSDYPWNYDGVRYNNYKSRYHGLFLLNCRMSNISTQTLQPYSDFITTEVYSYWPNAFGLYNMCGNVSEWLMDGEKHKGGNWMMPPYNCRISEPASAAGAPVSNGIGFRYVIEIIEIEDKAKLSSFEFDKKVWKDLMYIPGIPGSSKKIRMSNEINNLWYRQFLAENPDTNFRIRNEVWARHFRYPFFEQYGHHSAFNQYPVVGINYESAIAFCQWLTNKYNQWENKPYSKVVFRLPDTKEWEFAAKGGDNGPYPWNGSYLRNSRGCFLSNFAPFEERLLYSDSLGLIKWQSSGNNMAYSAADGLLIPGSIHAYFPNNYGLYNMSGNVSEMTSEKWVCKGGSWLTDQYQLLIVSQAAYENPSADLGFRIVAEIVE